MSNGHGLKKDGSKSASCDEQDSLGIHQHLLALEWVLWNYSRILRVASQCKTAYTQSHPPVLFFVLTLPLQTPLLLGRGYGHVIALIRQPKIAVREQRRTHAHSGPGPIHRGALETLEGLPGRTGAWKRIDLRGGSREGQGVGLLLGRRNTRNLPHGDITGEVRLFALRKFRGTIKPAGRVRDCWIESQLRQRANTLESSAGCADEFCPLRYFYKDRDFLSIKAPLHHAVIEDSQRVRGVCALRRAGRERGINRRTEARIDHELVDFPQYDFRQPFLGEVPHPAPGVLVGVPIDLPREIYEVGILANAAKPPARNRQLGLVALAATKRALKALPLGGVIRRTLPAPGAKLFRLREGGEECLEVGDGLIAHLCFRVGGHQPIGLAQRVPDLRPREPAAREVRSPGAFSLDAVTV